MSMLATLATLRERLPKMPVLGVGGATVAVLILGVLIGRSWLAAHDAAVHLAATLAAQEQVLAQADERQHQRDAVLAAALAKIAEAKRQVNTPPKAAAAIPQALPPLPQPIDIQLPEPTPTIPEPPATATIPQLDLKPIYDYLEDCRACQASLAATRDNLTDERAKLAAVTAQRDSAITAARGGSLWTRLRRNAKWFAIGAAAGALTLASAHSRPD